MIDNDLKQRFIFTNSGIRGEIVRLNASYRAILSKHDYPPPIRKLLGEALAIVSLLSTTLKTEGIVTLQIQSKGPITLLVTQANYLNQLRGIVHWEGDISTESLMTAFGEGNLVITINPGEETEKFQGIVELQGKTLSEALINYFQQSEQIKTYLYVTADDDAVAGILLQVLPPKSDNSITDDIHDSEHEMQLNWESIVQLTSTLTPLEILHLPNQEILHRLYANHEEDIRIFDSERLSFQCSCSRERMENALRLLSKEETLDIIKDNNTINVTCEFCNQKFEFDAVDVAVLFSDTAPISISETKH
jgi:molecular chaperone Hsp33